MTDDHIPGEEKIGDPRYDIRAQDDPELDDNSLRDRVESELFRFPEIPKGAFNINVVGHIVELRGEIDNGDMINTIVDLVRDVADVRDVHNYLHLPGEPAPNKESVLEATS